MLDKNVTDSYNSIKAPESLRNSLYTLEAEAKNKKMLRRKQILRPVFSAACLLVMLTVIIVFRMNGGENALIYGETVIGSEPVAITQEVARTAFGMERITQKGIPLEISVKDKSKISVSDGVLYVYDPKTEELISVVTHVTVSKDTQVRWDVTEAQTNSPRLYVETDRERTVYSLIYDEGGCFIAVVEP